MTERFLIATLVLLTAGCVVHVHRSGPDPTAHPGPGGTTHPEEQAVMTTAGEIVRCGGHDELVIEEKTIESDRVAVTVEGNCDVTILRSRLIGRDYGIVVQGNGDIQIDGSYVEGGVGAAMVQGNGTLTSRNTQYVGPVTHSGNGDVADEGGNTWTVLRK